MGRPTKNFAAKALTFQVNRVTYQHRPELTGYLGNPEERMETTEKVERTTAWLDVGIIKQAKAIATIRGEEKAYEVLERHLRASGLAAEYREVMAAEMARDLGGEG